MTIREIKVQRFSVTSCKPFDQVIAAFHAAIGHPDMKVFREKMTVARAEAELASVVNQTVSSSGLMEFNRFDLGDVLCKEQNTPAAKSLRFVVGNPLIMKQTV